MKLSGLGPKKPDVKVPEAVADVYRDLRDRRLLPLIALVLAAIVAVPFLLGGDPEVSPEVATGVAAEGAGGGTSTGVAAPGLTVESASPGLRDYHRRLSDRTPTDPFKQRYTGVPEGAQLRSVADASSSNEAGGGGESRVPVDGSGDADTEDSGAGDATPPGSAPGGTGRGGSGGDPGGGSGGKPRDLVEFAVDVLISRSEPREGESGSPGDPRVRHQVRPLESLPGPDAPAVTAMGVNLRTLKVMFLVSDRVDKLGGEFRCMARTPKGVCELLEVEPGRPFEVVYGPQDIRYRFKVTSVDAIPAGKVGGREKRDHLVGDLGERRVAP